MKRFKISRRMLQRDLKDLRDAGVIRLTLDKRMRQRDFCALNDIGYNIYYSHKYKAIIFEDDWDYSY